MEDPQARRERLRALKEAAQILEQPESGERAAVTVAAGAPEGNGSGSAAEREGPGQVGEEGQPGSVSFRNYIPRDEGLGKQKLPPAQVPKLKEPTPADTALLDSEDPITSIAPRKENWDLRRDVEKRLQKLERRTQRAMIQLMREEEDRRRQEEEGEEGGEDE